MAEREREGRDGGGWRKRDGEMWRRASARASQRRLSAQYGRPHQPSDLLTNEWERCQSACGAGERRSSLLPGIIAQQCGGTALASEGERGEGGGGGGGVARRGEPESGRYDARHDGKSNPLSGGRQGKRLTDKRDRRKTERERGEGAPKGLADQRGTPSKIMTMRKEMLVAVGGGRQSRDREGCRQERVGGGALTHTHTHHLKETFIPHMKGWSRDELS